MKKGIKKIFRIFVVLIFFIPVNTKIEAQVSFTKITTGPIPNDSSDSASPMWGDFDNDGDLDLLLDVLFPNPDNPVPVGFLYQNNCNGQFTRVTAIPGGFTTLDIGGGSSWVDYDNDGDLDIYLTAGGNNQLFRNNGDGAFTQIITGIIVNDPAPSRIAAWADINNDGFLDLYVGNNGGGSPFVNFLYRNNEDGTFTKVVTGDIVNDLGRTNALAWGDYDNDGDMDLFAGNRNEKQELYRNDGDTVFTKITGDPIVTDDPFQHVSTSWIDYDNDGDLDLFSARAFAPNSLFQNNGNGTFTHITTGDLVTENLISTGQTWGDLDNDGDLVSRHV